VFWIGVLIGWHFLFQFRNTHSRYILNRAGDKLQPCLNPLVTLKPFVIRFPIFIFELDPLYNDFIASINLVLIVDLSRVSHNYFNGTLPYAFAKSIHNSVSGFLFSIICVKQKMLPTHDLPARKPDCSSISIFLYSDSTNFANICQ